MQHLNSMYHPQYDVTPKFNVPSSVPSNTSTASIMFDSTWPTIQISPLFTVYAVPRSARHLRHHVFRSASKLPCSISHINYNTLSKACKLFHAERHVWGINTASNFPTLKAPPKVTRRPLWRLPCHVRCSYSNYIWPGIYEGWNFNSGNYSFTTDTK